jgi:signal transduction histidine kinase
MALPQRIDERAPSTREDRSRAALALELTRGWAWEYDVATRKLYRSHDISTLFGKPVGALAPTLEAYLEHIHPDDREKMKNAFREAISNRTGYDLEFRVEWPDGSIHWMAGHGRTLLDAKGKPCKVIGVDMDVTERKSLQQVVVDRERLVALGRISATLAHELNNPLSTVQNALYLLGKSGQLSERQGQILAMAQNEMRRSVEIIRSTLGIQREISAPIAADLRSLTDEVLTLFGARLRQQTIHVKRNYREAPRLLVFPGQIRQVLVNVIGNAVDAMPNGGVLAIRIAPSKMNNGREVRLLVCDSGPGVNRELRARVFEPFFTTKGQSGSGIGLWVTKQIVQKHGGEIRLRSCQSRERTGTCVSVSLPIGS